MHRRDFLKRSAMTAAAVSLLGAGALAEDERRPNIVLINCDDLGYGDLGCYGSELIATPNIDRMAQEGTRFTDFYSCGAVCTPSRAGLITGRYPMRSGLTRVLFPQDTDGLDDDQFTVAESLKRAGYATACIGKWHLGCRPHHLPTRHGFDLFYGIPYSNDMYKTRVRKTDPPIPLMRNEKIVEQPAIQETLTERYTGEAISFMRENRNRPFFIYLPHTFPHVPLHVSDRFKGKSKRGLYGDVVETIDWSVGAIVKSLKDIGIEKNTLVLFTSDNGPWLQQKENGGSAGPLRAGKGTPYEGGMREPFIAYWPGLVPAGRVCSQPGSNLDFLPTFTALAGGKLPYGHAVDGRDIRPLLMGTAKMPDYEFFYCQGSSIAAVRYGQWKLHRSSNGKPLEKPELYDLEADIAEKTNIAEQHPKLVAKLDQSMLAMQKDLQSDLQRVQRAWKEPAGRKD